MYIYINNCLFRYSYLNNACMYVRVIEKFI